MFKTLYQELLKYDLSIRPTQLSALLKKENLTYLNFM